MMSTLRWPLLHLCIAGWLLAGILACTGGVPEQSVLSEQRDGGAGTREAPVESDLVPAKQGDADSRAPLPVDSDRVLAEQGDAGAQARLGAAYYFGQDVAQDFGEAVRWARLAAEQGDAVGQGLLAAAYNTGRGVAQDSGEAVRWARLAAEQGDAVGQTVLAFAYAAPGVAQDFGEAVRWARLAAEQGDGSGQALLGMMYMQGSGVEQDDVSAYMWLTLGASGRGIAGAREMRDDVVIPRMTPEQIAEAEARVREWAK